jgi:hypothetical protein
LAPTEKSGVRTFESPTIRVPVSDREDYEFARAFIREHDLNSLTIPRLALLMDVY